MRGAGWGDAGERLLAGDASFRKYFRLTRPRESAVVMDAPAPQEDVRPFVRIGRHLIGHLAAALDSQIDGLRHDLARRMGIAEPPAGQVRADDLHA